MRYLALIAILALPAELSAAQAARSLGKAVETITAKTIAHNIGVIADDSMGGRHTTSRGLELTAQYVADQFKQFASLKPAGDNGTWFQRYPIRNDSTAPNTIGMLEGTDPKLKQEYIVLVAHMDHIGTGRGNGLESIRNVAPQPPDDSIYNGADDNASGTAGIIELARAFSQPGAAPRRSVIFLVVSGEEGGRKGSKYFVEHSPVPLQQIVAAINLDMIGRNSPDSIVVVGARESDLGVTVERMSTAHPELRMIPVAAKKWIESSDHTSFAEKGIPSLLFFNRLHTDYHLVTDTPDKINAEKEARLLRLVFYVGHEVASTDQKPKWDTASYEKLVKQP